MNISGQDLTIVATVLGLIGVALNIGGRLGKLELKVETMWGFQVHRAIAEVAEKGLGKIESPLVFNGEVCDRLNPLKGELIQFWKSNKAKFKNADEALLGLEGKFGVRLVKLICLPYKTSHGACLILAYLVATESTELDLDVLFGYSTKAA